MIPYTEELLFKWFKSKSDDDFVLMDAVRSENRKYGCRLLLKLVQSDIPDITIYLSNNMFGRDEYDVIFTADDYKWANYFVEPKTFRIHEDSLHIIKMLNFKAWFDGLINRKISAMTDRKYERTTKKVEDFLKKLKYI